MPITRSVEARQHPLEGHGVSLVADRYRDSAGVQPRRHLPLRHAGQAAEHRPELFGALHCLIAVSLALRPPSLTPAGFLSCQCASGGPLAADAASSLGGKK